MLATIGFGVSSILFFIFAMSVELLSTKKSQKILRIYAQAYMFVSYAFIFWALASAVNSSRLLAFSVVVGDILLAAATFLMLNILLANKANKKSILYVSALVLASLLIVRVVYFYPEPYMTNGVLFFNSQRFVSFTIAFTFLFIWFPVNLQISDLLTYRAQQLKTAYTYLFTAATLSAVIFLLAKAPLTVVMSFTAISISFLMLIISSRYIRILEKHTHGSK
jgi:hypothetical protein